MNHKASAHVHGSTSTFANIMKGKGALQRNDEPVMVLERGSLNYDGGPILVGCVKDFKTLPNIHNVCSSKGFTRITVSYLGGYWVLLEFESTQSCEKFQKHSGDLEGKIAVICAKEITRWVPNFGVEDNVQSKDDNHSLHEDDDDEGASDTFHHNANDLCFEEKLDNQNDELSGDPFGFTLLNSNHQDREVVKDVQEGSPTSVNNGDTNGLFESKYQEKE
ncbi:hypothetical protein Tco_0291099 [Tanacetum coccineum]